MPWTLTIVGDGSTYSDAWPQDADRMVAQLVRAMKSAGHDIEVATFDDGKKTLQLRNPDVHIIAREAVEAEFRRKQEEADAEKRRQEDEQKKLAQAGEIPMLPPMQAG
jgi:hypothetical protein